MEDKLNGRAEAGKPVSKGFCNNAAGDDYGLAWMVVVMEIISGLIQIIF